MRNSGTGGGGVGGMHVRASTRFTQGIHTVTVATGGDGGTATNDDYSATRMTENHV